MIKTAYILAISFGSTFSFTPKVVLRPNNVLYAERKPFITGNWKLNPQTKDEAVQLAREISSHVTPSSPCDVALFVPYPFIEGVQSAVIDKFPIGAEVRKNSFLRYENVIIIHGLTTKYHLNYELRLLFQNWLVPLLLEFHLPCCNQLVYNGV